MSMIRSGACVGPSAVPLVEESFEVASVGHADRLPCSARRASASSAARMARWALWSRDRAVPGGMPGRPRSRWVCSRGSGGGRGSPLVRRQPAGHAPAGHDLEGERTVGDGRPVDRQHPEARGPASLARRLVEAFVDDDAVQPGVEPVRIAEPAQVAPGDHQRFLQGILGPIDVAQDPMSEREEPVDARRIRSTNAA